MLDRLRAVPGRLREALGAGRRRLRRVERREVREFRAWLETTRNVVHLSVLLFVPLLVAVVTYLSNHFQGLSFLLFPPLASGTYTLFSDPEGEYATPGRFVGGLTAGALCGWAALAVASTVEPPTVGTGLFQVSAFAAGTALFLVGAVTWALSIEEPSAFSTALIGLLVPPGREPTFVVGVFLASLLVAAVFVLWRDQFFERRARFLYQSIRGDDHVLVPLVGEEADATAMLAGRLAGAHEAGKVVLLDVVDDRAVARAERSHLRQVDGVDLVGTAADPDRLPTAADEVAVEDETGPEPGEAASEDRPQGAAGDDESNREASDDGGQANGEDHAANGEDPVAGRIAEVEDRAAAIERSLDVPCEVLVAANGDGLDRTVLDAAAASNCDLVTVPFTEREGSLAPWIRRLFRGDVDVLVHRSADGRTAWSNAMVPIRGPSDVAHSMIDFARRLAGAEGSISVCTCIGPDGDRRRAESMLSDLVGAFAGPIETRVSRAEVAPFLADNARHYDVVFVGASRDRSAASRLVSPPTFERLRDLDADVAIVDRRG